MSPASSYKNAEYARGAENSLFHSNRINHHRLPHFVWPQYPDQQQQGCVLVVWLSSQFLILQG
jgi:hypothetical protein